MSKLIEKGSKLELLISKSAAKELKMSEVKEYSDTANLIVMQSPGGGDANFLIDLNHMQGKAVVVDYDDYSFDLSPGNPRYAQLGTVECSGYAPDGKKIIRWRDGENGFDLKDNITKYEAFVQSVKKSDMVTVTTDYIASKFRHHSENVEVVPNLIDFDFWKPQKRPERLKDQIRIGWFGGDSHLYDLKMFKTLLPAIASKYPQVKFVVQGPYVPDWRPLIQSIPQDRLEWHDWSQIEDYPLFLSSRHFDIGLCPLEDNEFNKCKSNIKCLEFSALKVPVVAQKMIPYSNHIVDGKTGLLADAEGEWINQVSLLIENAELRRNLAEESYRHDFEHFNLDKDCWNWERAYMKCLENFNDPTRCCSQCGSRRSRLRS